MIEKVAGLVAVSIGLCLVLVTLVFMVPVALGDMRDLIKRVLHAERR